MKTAKSIIVVLFVLLTAQIASAYYCPSTGRWLSRDPIGEPGFETVRSENTLPSVGSAVRLRPTRWIQRDPIESKNEPNRYVFVKNNPESKLDWLGLSSEPDVSWAPAPCPNGWNTIFIQVLYGGIGPYSGPRVDDGSAGYFGGGGKGCPDYNPSGMSPGIFQDSPSGLTGPVEFIVCRVCTAPCCINQWVYHHKEGGFNWMRVTAGYKIMSVGPCVHWKKGDKGDLSDKNEFLTYPYTPHSWLDAMQSQYPNAASGGCTPNCKN